MGSPLPLPISYTRAHAYKHVPPQPPSCTPCTGTPMYDSGGWPWPRGTQPLRFAFAGQVPHAPPFQTRLASRLFYSLSLPPSLCVSLSLPPPLPLISPTPRSVASSPPVGVKERRRREEVRGEARCREGDVFQRRAVSRWMLE